MAVIEVKEMIDRAGDATGEEVNDTRTFRVRVDSPTDTITTISTSGGLPAYLAPHPANAYMTARSLAITPMTSHWQWWKAVVKYSTAPLTQREKEKQEPNPLNRPAKIRWDSQDEQQALFCDEDGNAMVNSAGDYYDPSPIRVVGNWTVTIEKNVPYVPEWLQSYRSAVNEDEFSLSRGVILGTGTSPTLDIPPGYARLARISISESMEENGFNYVVLTMTLELKEPHPVPDGQVLDPITKTPVTPDPWDEAILDQGLRQRVSTTGTGTGTAAAGRVKQIKDSEGNMINSPVPLDGDGYRLTDPTPSSVFYFRHRIYKRKPFSALPLA